MQNAARTYFTTQVTTTTQGDLLIMLFDAALKFLSQGRAKLLERDFAQKGILISKALDILAELQATLNPSKGGQMAEQLQKLYLYCSSRLLRANRTMDPQPLDEAVRILTGLREAFAEANARAGSKPVTVQAAQSSGRGLSTGIGTPHQAVAASVGAAEYAMVGDAGSGGVPAAGSEAPSVAPTGDASIETPRASQTMLAEAAAQMRESAALAAPRPMAPVRRAMAAYSSSMAG